MIRLLWLSGFLFLLSVKSLAQIALDIALIPDSLSLSANAVVRSQKQSIEIVNEGTANESFYISTTVFNQKGRSHGAFYIPYDKFSSVISASGVIYDSRGNVLKKIKKADFKDASATSGGTLYGDNRMLVYESPIVNYPLTFQFEYTKQYKGLLFIPPFDPIPQYEVSVQHAEYKITAPSEVGLRAHSMNGGVKFEDGSSETKFVYEWSINNFPAIKQEPFSPPSSEVFPYVLVGVNKFKMEEFVGEMTSWHSFGKWISQLNQGRDDLSNEAVESVRQMTEGLNEVDKVRVLYDYLQSRTRYVSIQLGIGGWQPFPASFVEKNGYGDCKALVNYMRSLLKAADINSYYTLIRAGSKASSINTAFPSSQFNHVILCVPIKADTIWLECTSQTKKFGFLGSFTSDRQALLINEEGGRLIKTPRYSAEDNLQITRANVNFLENGSGEFEIFRESSGLQAENYGLDQIVSVHESEQRKWLNESIGIESINIERFSISRRESSYGELIGTDLNATARNVYSKSGKRIFVKPNILNAYKANVGSTSPRKFPVFLRSDFLDVDTINISIPETYKVEFLPKPKNLENQFGKYLFQMELNPTGDVLTYIRVLQLNKGVFPAESFEELSEFFKEIAKGDEQKVVLVASD